MTLPFALQASKPHFGQFGVIGEHLQDIRYPDKFDSKAQHKSSCRAELIHNQTG
jgi:hypothetical protein